MKRNGEMVCENRKARFSYEYIETYVAGLQLFGNEMKSVRLGNITINDGYGVFVNGELFMKGLYIQTYENRGFVKTDERRDIKLLLRKTELKKLHESVKLKGNTIVPLKVFIDERGYAKMVIALAKGKSNYDKRHTIKERDIKRELEREL